MAGKRVQVIDPNGRLGTVDQSDVQNLPDGARVLTAQELAQQRLDEQEAKKPATQRVADKINFVSGLIAPSPSLVTGSPLNVEHEAFLEKSRETYTAGLFPAAKRVALDQASPGAGKRYAERLEDLETASPTSSGAGAVYGMASGIASSSGGGAAAKLLPTNALAAAGAPIEQGVAKALGGLASKGALGKAATTGAGMAVRGAVEGAAYSGIETAASSVTHDTPITGEKLYGATGHGALLGGGLGLALGFTGSLAASGARGIASRIGRSASKAEPAIEGAGRRQLTLDQSTLDAGITESPGATESPIKMFGKVPEMRAPRGSVKTEVPFSLTDRVSFDPDAGLRSAGEEAAGLKMSKSGKAVRLDPGGMPESLPARDVISLAPPGIDGAITGSRDPIRKMANEQAWNSFGKGFGLQTTKFAQQAQKYFPNGTADLGEVAIRHGIIDVGEAGSPWKAGFQAAKSGTPGEMLSRSEAALQKAGERVGEITEASGARVTQKQVQSAIDSVAKEYEGIAAQMAVGRSIRSFGRDLTNVMNLTEPGATASVQDLILQRRGIDQIAFKGSQSINPTLQNQAKQKLRRALEDIAENVMDEASSRVPGELKAQYNVAKRDYHALKIVNDAITDSAARIAKNSSLGLFEKATMAGGAVMGLLTGNPAALAAPGLALGGKLIRERGNAAAAAFLSRAADAGTFEGIVNRYNAKLKSAAAGVINERPKGAPGGAPKAESPETGKRAVGAVQSTAKAITQWVGDFQTNPRSVIEQVQDTAANVSRAAGPKAAESYTANTMRAIAFISAHIPVKERRDPLDPRSIPALTFEESDRLVRATRYALKPETIFDDFERGIVTPEGIRAAKTFQPESFVEFQLDLQKQVTERIMRGQVLSQSQRLKVDRLLGYGVSRPETIQRLQTHFAAAEPPSAPPGGPPAPAGPPISMNVQQSGFDAVEARMTG